MSTKLEAIGKIDVVVDHDCGNYRIGEIFQDPGEMAKKHVQQYGDYGYEQMRDYAIRILEAASLEIKLKRDAEFRAQCQTGSKS